ncbi:MAG: MFS transporter [Simkaniaceae bacterium]
MNDENKLVVHPRPFYAWCILILSVLFNAYAYMLQSTPTIDDFTQGSAAHLSGLVYALSGYLYAFTLFQIPMGILIDRFGSRYFPSLGLLLCALGAILLSYSNSNGMIFFSKVIMGCGGAFSFINALKLISNWFQPKRYAFLLGLFIALDTLGIILLKAFYLALKNHIEWRGATLMFGLSGLIFACVFFFVVKDSPGVQFSIHPPAKKEDLWKNIKQIFNNSQVWVIGITVGLLIGPLFSFEMLWSIPFVSKAYNAPFQIAALLNLLFVFGYGIGAMYFGRASTNLGRRKVFMPWGIGVTLLMMLVILYPPYMGINVTAVCFFVLGFAASTNNLGYVIIHELHVPQVTATAVAVVNTFYALFSAISQALIAVFIQLGSFMEKTGEVSLHNFQLSLIRLPVYVGISLLFSFFIKETFAKQRYSYED